MPACYFVCRIRIQNNWRIYFDFGKLVSTFDLGDSIYYITIYYKSKIFLRIKYFYI